MPGEIKNENCIGLWKSQLEDATNQLVVIVSEYDKLNAAYQDLCNWVIQLQDCLDSLDETDEKRDVIIDLLNLFVAQAESVCENIVCLKEALEILYCDIIQVSKCLESLYNTVITLRTEIDSLNKNITEENSETYKCLIALQVQIEKVLELYQVMVDQILDAATMVYRVECLLCNTETGLLKKLTDLIGYLGGVVNQAYCSTDGVNQISPGKTLCEEKLDAPKFPLADGDIYQGIKMTLTKAGQDKETCKNDLDILTQEKDKLEACTSSLQKAIDEATKASQAK
ncbi:MAG: hypothetical protein AAFZ15_11845 [Bacteroidota bacterium]